MDADRIFLDCPAYIDRDGTARQTTLKPAEAVRLNAIAQRLGISPSEVLRRAAHIPVQKHSVAGSGRTPEPTPTGAAHLPA